MTQQELKQLKQKITYCLDKRRLRDAILEIESKAREINAWDVIEKVQNTQNNYRYMLSYMANGTPDPQRNAIYDDMVCEIYSLYDILVNHIERDDNPSLYYSNIRYALRQQDQPSLANLLGKYTKLAERFSLFSLLDDNGNPQANEKTMRRECEKIQSDIFIRIWSTPLLSSEDAEAITQTLESSNISAEMKRLIVSAVTLGLWQAYDNRRLRILMTTYLYSKDIQIGSEALVGLLLGLWKYRNRPLSHKVREILAAVKEKDTWQRDLRLAYIEIIRARDTERINRKMRDELLPKMEKLRPDLIDKFNKANLDAEDPMAMQENPEWQELLEKSGVADQLKELTEIQMEGGDVMMSTFAHLKQFPFFNTISNWFLPFDAQHTAVSDVMAELDIIGDMMENARFLCDSDKYSFMLALTSVPKDQKQLMVSQMKAQSQNIYEMMGQMGADGSPEVMRLALNNYMQNIYRFFKLFYRKNEFLDPFETGVNLITVPALAADFDDAEMLKVVAEFYFKLKYMQDAVDVYLRLEDFAPGDASRYQKMGYAYESMHDYQKAIEYYQRAELLDSRSNWTLKRLAYCYRALGDKANSLKYYAQLADADPDNLHTALLYGQSLLDNRKYTEALHQFYKVEFLDEKSTKAWRPLAWTLLLTGDFDGAAEYYKKIMDDAPTANDYLNFGHVELAKGNIGKAINLYVKAISQNANDTEWFVKALASDRESLASVGVDTTIIPLVTDATLYEVLNK